METLSSQPVWHETVLHEESVRWMVPPGGRFFVDGTVGGAGHASLLLEMHEDARILGIDRDPVALAKARERLAPFGERASLSLGTYATLPEHLAAVGFPPQVDGILLDLGVNSSQLDEGERGFSFRHDGPLDMRFSQENAAQPTAATLLNTLSVQELTLIFRKWGEEPRAKQAARAIVKAREVKPFVRTRELHQCLLGVLMTKKSRAKQVDPTTRCFQALRIAVNDELQHLATFLSLVPKWLAPGGHVAMISFHSLEDRPVKQEFRRWAKGCVCPPDFPVCACGKEPMLELLTRKPILPSEEEVQRNPRSRSAKLRVARRTEAPWSEEESTSSASRWSR